MAPGGDGQDLARNGPLPAVPRHENAIFRTNCTCRAEQRPGPRPPLTSRTASPEPPKPTTKLHLPSSRSTLSTGPRAISETDPIHTQRDPYLWYPRLLAQQLLPMLTPVTRTISRALTVIRGFILSGRTQCPHRLSTCRCGSHFLPDLERFQSADTRTIPPASRAEQTGDIIHCKHGLCAFST